MSKFEFYGGQTEPFGMDKGVTGARKPNKNPHRHGRKNAGQTTTEYILILAVIVAVILKFRSTLANFLQDQLKSLTASVSSSINSSTSGGP